jgi:LysM repeat protein
MAEKESQESTEVEHSYLDVGPTGPRVWALAIGAVVVGLAILGAFYGLYTINRLSAPTPSPDLPAMTRAAAAKTAVPKGITPSPGATLVATAPTLTPARTITATAEPPTYTVQQGDTLIAIANRLNVDVTDLTRLNGISSETIFPSQVLMVPPTVTPWPETGPFPHIVSRGETLLSIATFYDVTVAEIKTLNGFTSDTIFVGQRVLIPASGVRPSTPTPTPEPWGPTIITGELDALFSLTTVKGRFNLHIPPDTRAAATGEVDKISRLVETALDHSQAVLQRRLSGRFDVYVAGTLFEAPLTNHRSSILPDERQLFLLYDGSGTPAERLYFTTYAVTHLLATQKLGKAASPLLGEGLAVYAGGQALVNEVDQDLGYLSLTEICAAYQFAGRLPRVSRPLTFEGHLGHLDHYFAAGCFVDYLVAEEGWAAFTEVYTNGDYRAVYGRSLNQLESDWSVALQDAADDLLFDPDEMVRALAEIDEAYLRLFEDFAGTPTQLAAYERLDRARLALLQGRLSSAQEHLELFESIFSNE